MAGDKRCRFVPLLYLVLALAWGSAGNSGVEYGNPPSKHPLGAPSPQRCFQPIDADKSPKVHVPPLNHIGLWIDDLPRAVAWLGEQGLRMAPGGIRKGAAGYDIAFLHPKSTEGVLIELVQAPPDVIAAHGELR